MAYLNSNSRDDEWVVLDERAEREADEFGISIKDLTREEIVEYLTKDLHMNGKEVEEFFKSEGLN